MIEEGLFPRAAGRFNVTDAEKAAGHATLKRTMPVAVKE